MEYFWKNIKETGLKVDFGKNKSMKQEAYSSMYVILDCLIFNQVHLKMNNLEQNKTIP